MSSYMMARARDFGSQTQWDVAETDIMDDDEYDSDVEIQEAHQDKQKKQKFRSGNPGDLFTEAVSTCTFIINCTHKRTRLFLIYKQ